MKNLLLSICAIFCVVQLSAQEEAVYNHYVNNHFLINPGSAGFNAKQHRLFFNYRSQWAGFPGSPQTYTLNYNSSIGTKVGFGASVSSDKIADLQKLRASIALAYRYQVEKLEIGFGITPEFHRYQLSSDVMEGYNFEPGDPALEDLQNGISNIDLSVGIYSRFDDKLFIGFSLPNLIKNRLDQIELNGDEGSNSPFRYYTAMLGYRFELGDKGQFYLEPSVVSRKVRTAPTFIDLNLMAGFMEEKVLTGLTYTAGSEGALGLYLEHATILPRLCIHTIYTWVSFSNTTQEYMKSQWDYCFRVKKKGNLTEVVNLEATNYPNARTLYL